MSVHNCSGRGALEIPAEEVKDHCPQYRPEINLYNSCPEKCAILNSQGRPTSSIMVMWRAHMRSDFPEHKTILCIDDDGGMLGTKKRCSSGADIKCSRLTLPGKAYKLQQCALLPP